MANNVARGGEAARAADPASVWLAERRRGVAGGRDGLTSLSHKSHHPSREPTPGTEKEKSEEKKKRWRQVDDWKDCIASLSILKGYFVFLFFFFLGGGGFAAFAAEDTPNREAEGEWEEEEEEE